MEPEDCARVDEARRQAGYNPNVRRGFRLPWPCRRADTACKSARGKIWLLIAPDGARHRVVNLLDWASRHADWFDAPNPDGPADRERIARNIRSGFGHILRSMQGRRKNPCYTYKGWRLGDWPRDKQG